MTFILAAGTVMLFFWLPPMLALWLLLRYRWREEEVWPSTFKLQPPAFMIEPPLTWPIDLGDKSS